MRFLPLAVAALLMAACEAEPPWDGNGVVTNKTYDDPDEWTTQGVCVGRDPKTQACTARTPAEQHHDGPHWWVQVTSTDGREHHVEVDHVGYLSCRLGAAWSVGRCLS